MGLFLSPLATALLVGDEAAFPARDDDADFKTMGLSCFSVMPGVAGAGHGN